MNKPIYKTVVTSPFKGQNKKPVIIEINEKTGKVKVKR
jgi:hypothetical protein